MFFFVNFFNHEKTIFFMLNFKNQYSREARLFYDCSRHCNVCRFYGLMQVNEEKSFIIMELFENSLSERILNSAIPFTNFEKINLSEQISAGINMCFHIRSKKLFQ